MTPDALYETASEFFARYLSIPDIDTPEACLEYAEVCDPETVLDILTILDSAFGRGRSRAKLVLTLLLGAELGRKRLL